MEKWLITVLLAAGLGLFVISILARIRYGDKYDLKAFDFVLIIIPLLFVLLITGKVKVLEAFGVKADLTEVFRNAASANIEQQVAIKSSPSVDQVVTMLNMAEKTGVQQIPQLVQNKTEALVFRLGHGHYYGPAIQTYFDALYASSYLQYLIVLDQEGKLFGIYNALDLAVYFRTQGENAYRNFARWLNQAEESSKRQLAALPGFVSAKQSVTRELSKQSVLKRMDDLRVDSLPVVDDTGFFVGTVERSQLTASLILDVVSQLEHK